MKVSLALIILTFAFSLFGGEKQKRMCWAVLDDPASTVIYDYYRPPVSLGLSQWIIVKSNDGLLFFSREDGNTLSPDLILQNPDGTKKKASEIDWHNEPTGRRFWMWGYTKWGFPSYIKIPNCYIQVNTRADLYDRLQ